MWEFDNAIFNVNGSGFERLKLALELALGDSTIVGWKVKKNKGICLYSYSSSDKEINLFPTPLSYDEVASVVFKWLESDEAETIELSDWDYDLDHDGSNSLGWRVYTEDWGHIDDDWHMVAITPAYLWYGK